MKALILGGGNALGSYLAGAYEALHEADQTLDWISGTSIGAITAGLIAGNPTEHRIARLHDFWARVTAPNMLPWTGGGSWLSAIQTRLLGRPSLFHPHLRLMSSRPQSVGVYDLGPMRATLESLIDFDRLNSGRPRVSVVAVDLETSQDVVFDTAAMRIEVSHLMASAALIPDFPPVRIGERWLVDGGLAQNVPLDPVLGGSEVEDMVCFLADLFPADGAVPHELSALGMRQSDLTFACQTERSLRAWAARYGVGCPHRRVDVVRTSYRAEAETAMKTWDFSGGALSQRWEAGQMDMRAALDQFLARPTGGPGLTIHPVVRALRRDESRLGYDRFKLKRSYPNSCA